MRSLRKDESGMSHVLEFIIVFTAFLVVLSAFFAAVANQFRTMKEESTVKIDVIRLSDGLIGSTGRMENNDTNWELYPASGNGININDNLLELGFRVEWEYGILSLEKVLRMNYLTYETVERVLRLGAEHINISIVSLSGESILTWGASGYESAREYAKYTRIINVYDNSNDSYTPAEFTIHLFQGGNINERLIMNEVMYNPLGGETDYEWIELYNPTCMAVNVNNWIIGDLSGYERLIGLNNETIIPANGYGIIAGSPQSVLAFYNISQGVTMLMPEIGNTIGDGLGDYSDHIYLRNPKHATIDTLSYQSSWGVDVNGDTFHANGANESLEKFNPFGENNSSNWGESWTDGHGGTPGRENSRS